MLGRKKSDRELGTAPNPEGRHTRLVERYVLHGEPMDFRELCLEAVPTEADYIVLDLDKTFHLDVNLGERLGWELVARSSYGQAHLDRAEPHRAPGRGLIDWSRPLGVLRFGLTGAGVWGLPGLYYLVWGRIASAQPLLRTIAYRRFGEHPVRRAQYVPQTVLLTELAKHPIELVRTLAEGIYRREAPLQVIEPDDIAWLRARCPKARIVISSASPEPMVRVAAEMLGVDDVVSTTIDHHDGHASTPLTLRGVKLHRRPRRVSPPSALNINSGHAKVRRLEERFPDVFTEGVISVGISDTGYGEDHCWAEYFTRVVDINSPTPFPPVVTAQSPVEEIHSAVVLTREERMKRDLGETRYLTDGRRIAARNVPTRVFDRRMLAEAMGGLAPDLEGLAAGYARARQKLDDTLQPLRDALDALDRAQDQAANIYNEARGLRRIRILSELRRLLRKQAALARRIARGERPLSRLRLEMRRRLDGTTALLTEVDFDDLAARRAATRPKSSPRARARGVTQPEKQRLVAR